MTPLTRAERETIIRISDDPEDCLHICTMNETQAQRLIKAGAGVRRKGSRGNCEYWLLTAPREWFQWPRPKKRVSETQRAAAGARMKVLQAARKAAKDSV